MPFFMAFAFSALRWACAGLTLFSFGMVGGVLWNKSRNYVLRWKSSRRVEILPLFGRGSFTARPFYKYFNTWKTLLIESMICFNLSLI